MTAFMKNTPDLVLNMSLMMLNKIKSDSCSLKLDSKEVVFIVFCPMGALLSEATKFKTHHEIGQRLLPNHFILKHDWGTQRTELTWGRG